MFLVRSLDSSNNYLRRSIMTSIKNTVLVKALSGLIICQALLVYISANIV